MPRVRGQKRGTTEKQRQQEVTEIFKCNGEEKELSVFLFQQWQQNDKIAKLTEGNALFIHLLAPETLFKCLKWRMHWVCIEFARWMGKSRRVYPACTQLVPSSLWVHSCLRSPGWNFRRSPPTAAQSHPALLPRLRLIGLTQSRSCIVLRLIKFDPRRYWALIWLEAPSASKCGPALIVCTLSEEK